MRYLRVFEASVFRIRTSTWGLRTESVLNSVEQDVSFRWVQGIKLKRSGPRFSEKQRLTVRHCLPERTDCAVRESVLIGAVCCVLRKKT